MLESRREFDFAEEPIGAENRGQLGAENFDRDRAIVPEVPGGEDQGHSARAKPPVDRVAAGECSAEPSEDIRGRLQATRLSVSP